MTEALVSMTLNGASIQGLAEPRMHLADFLRAYGNLPSVRVSCEYGVCGCCSLMLDGRVVRGCLVLAVQAEGRDVRTLEGLVEETQDLREAFVQHNALQCGYCTPAMLITAHELITQAPDADRQAIREGLSGNYCRCTGYHAIVDAVDEAAQERRAKPGADHHGK
jgi:carbon-monoxide dehydrogenase small subunit